MTIQLLFAGLTAGFLTTSVTAAAAEPATPDVSTIFGIRLAGPIAMPECAIVSASEHERRHYAMVVYDICYTQLDLGQPLPPNVRLDIRWPFGPSGWRPPVQALSVQLYDGSVECIHWATRGVVSQLEDLRKLTARFGEPTEVTRPIVETGRAEKVQGIAAKWKIGDVAVTFSSAPEEIRTTTPNLHIGWVDVETGKCRAERHEQ